MKAPLLLGVAAQNTLLRATVQHTSSIAETSRLRAPEEHSLSAKQARFLASSTISRISDRKTIYYGKQRIIINIKTTTSNTV
ncbi:MAG: hypothetical protein OCC46_13335 [Pseudodesulfovibrio sp.]